MSKDKINLAGALSQRRQLPPIQRGKGVQISTEEQVDKPANPQVEKQESGFVDLTTNGQDVISTNTQVDLSRSKQNSETASPQNEKATNGEVDLPTSLLVCKTISGDDDKSETLLVVEPTKLVEGKTTNGLVDKPASGNVDKTIKPQMEKYTTHLKPATIRSIKLYAVTHDMKDYEVVQRLIDLGFEYIDQKEED